ncbi:MAG: site-2 protease family protein, partial [Bryobacterales bacterium]|nr:site-2 protease family protein [Bryobacterales bacterium]
MMQAGDTQVLSVPCASCRASIAEGALVCPYCLSLVHRERLETLAGLAAKAEQSKNMADALARYQQMRLLLPPDTTQARVVAARIEQLSASAGFDEAASLAAPLEPTMGFDFAGLAKKGLAAAGAGLFFAWKFKFALLGVLSKGKLLLLGLTKFSTVASMFAFLGVYWNLYGFAFALGIVLLIYVHEMGHVWAAKRLGIPVTAPMFIPGFGAFIGLRTRLANAIEEAYLGLAGPIWGVAGSLVCLGLWALLSHPLLLVVASFSAMINLFNLVPVWQLDGAHAFKAFSVRQRWVALLFPLLVAMFFWDGMLLLVSAGAAYQIFYLKRAPATGHRTSLVHFCGLVLVIALVLQVGGPLLHPTDEPLAAPQPVIQS